MSRSMRCHPCAADQPRRRVSRSSPVSATAPVVAASKPPSRDQLSPRAHARRALPPVLPLARKASAGESGDTARPAPRLRASRKLAARAERDHASALPFHSRRRGVELDAFASGFGRSQWRFASFSRSTAGSAIERPRLRRQQARVGRPDIGCAPTAGRADSAFRLLSGSADRRAGGHAPHLRRVPDEALARETFFQAGFYSYTRETCSSRGGPRSWRRCRDSPRARRPDATRMTSIAST